MTQLEDEKSRGAALIALKSEVSSTTASMTSIPKPLKYLKEHYESLKETRLRFAEGDKVRLGNLLSVLAMVHGKPRERESLKFLLESERSDLVN